MTVVRIHVPQQHRNAIHTIDHYADLAIVEDIAKRGSAANGDGRKSGPFDRRNKLKFAILQIVIK